MVPDLLKSLKTAHTHSWVLTKNSADEVRSRLPESLHPHPSRKVSVLQVYPENSEKRFFQQCSVNTCLLVPRFHNHNFRTRGVEAAFYTNLKFSLGCHFFRFLVLKYIQNNACLFSVFFSCYLHLLFVILNCPYYFSEREINLWQMFPELMRHFSP